MVWSAHQRDCPEELTYDLMRFHDKSAACVCAAGSMHAEDTESQAKTMERTSAIS